MDAVRRHACEVEIGGRDPDGHRGATVLAAWFALAEARALRREVWTGAALGAAVLALLAATTPLINRIDLMTMLPAIGLAAALAWLVERRAQRRLRRLSPGDAPSRREARPIEHEATAALHS